MFFNGGIIPNYVLISTLGLKNTMWAVVLPGRAVGVQPAGDEVVLREHADASWRRPPQIDGLGWFGIFSADRAAAVEGGHRDDDPVLLGGLSGTTGSPRSSTSTSSDLFPRHAVPAQPHRGCVDHGDRSGAAAPGSTSTPIAANIQAVTMILTIIPILCVYPFVQRYFVSGVMLGSVKG